MRRVRWAAVVSAASMLMIGPMAVGPAAAVVPTTATITGSIVLPVGETWRGWVNACIPLEGNDWCIANTSFSTSGPFEIQLTDLKGPTDVYLTVMNAGLSSGDYHQVSPGQARLTMYRADATVMTVLPGTTVTTDPVQAVSKGQVTVAASNSSGADISSEVGWWSVYAVKPGSGPWTRDESGGQAATGAPISMLSGEAFVVGVNRDSGFSKYTGRYFTAPGVLGSATRAGATSLTLAPAENRAVDVRLDTCGTVSGTVTGGTDGHYRRVTVFNDANQELVTRQAAIAADGTFKVSGLLPGDYFVAPMGYRYGSSSFSWLEGTFVDPTQPGAVGGTPLTIASCSTAVTGVALELPSTGLVSQRPVRVADLAGVTPGVARCVQVTGRAGVPAGASGVMLNVTTDRPTSQGYVVVYPDTAGNGATVPPAGSTVNFEPGAAVANAAFVQLPRDGKVCIFTRGAPSVRVVMDVTGYVMPDAGITMQASQRLVDTRAGALHVGPVAGPVTGRVTKSVQVRGQAGVPADAKAVLLNVTVVGATGVGNLRVFPEGASVPNASVVNYSKGLTKANATIVSLPASGKVSFYSDAGFPVDVILDVVGSVGPSSAFTGVTPVRVIDTRAKTRIGTLAGPLAGRTVHSVDLSGAGGIPAEATAVVLNVTAIGPTGIGNLRVYPDAADPGSSVPPNSSSLNYVTGRDVPNLVVVAVSGSGRVNFWSDSAGTVQLAADVVGYLTDPAPGV